MQEKIIPESGGKQEEIYNFSGQITETLIMLLNNYIKFYEAKLKDGAEWHFGVSEIPTEFLKEKTNIGKIKTEVNFTYSLENIINGKFETSKTILLNDDSYEITLLLSIKTQNDIKTFSYELEEIVVHELHHAFRYIKTLNKNSKANALNKTKNFTWKQLQLTIQDNPTIKEFMQMIYLSLPQEIEARVQETATKLKYIKKTTPNQTIETLRQFQPLRDAKRMLNYSTKEIKKIDPEVIKPFVNAFNKNLKTLSEYNIKNTTESFFEYWGKIIRNKGDVLFKKILRLVADKYQVKNENVLITEIDEKLLKDISGYEF